MMAKVPAEEAVAPASAAERIAAAFGVAAAITVVFNVVLALIKDAYAPLNTFMAHLTGHHWITHGLADLLLFLLLGWLFTAVDIPARGLSQGLVVAVGGATIFAGALLAAWFVFV
jgi:hypothetical protein